MKYNYLEAVKEDIKNYLLDNISEYDTSDLDDFKETLYDDLWTEDSVTGNASGSYTFNNEEAKGYVGDNLDLMVEAFKEFDDTSRLLDCLENFDFETIDVTIRCYLLSQAIDEVLDESDFEELGISGFGGFIGDDE